MSHFIVVPTHPQRRLFPCLTRFRSWSIIDHFCLTARTVVWSVGQACLLGFQDFYQPRSDMVMMWVLLVLLLPTRRPNQFLKQFKKPTPNIFKTSFKAIFKPSLKNYSILHVFLVYEMTYNWTATFSIQSSFDCSSFLRYL